MNTITQDMRFRQAVIEYSFEGLSVRRADFFTEVPLEF